MSKTFIKLYQTRRKQSNILYLEFEKERFMLENKHIKLGGLLQLNLLQLYESDAIDCIKDQLEAMHGVSLQKIQSEKFINIRCENAQQPLFCHYSIIFSSQFRIDRASRMVLRLESFYVQHRPQCRNADDASFLRNKHILNQNYLTIVKMVRRRYENGQQIKNPTHVLQLLCEQENLNKNFLYQGLGNLETRRRIKKRFDNMVADAKKKYKQLVNSSAEKTKQDGEQKKQEREENKQQAGQKVVKVRDDEEKDQKQQIALEISAYKPIMQKIPKNKK